VVLYHDARLRDRRRRRITGAARRRRLRFGGQDDVRQELASLAPRGMLVLFGQSSARSAHSIRKSSTAKGSLYLTRPHLGHYVVTRENLLARANAVLGWVKSGELHVRIGATFRMRDAAEAHRALESRPPRAKWCSSLERDACRPDVTGPPPGRVTVKSSRPEDESYPRQASAADSPAPSAFAIRRGGDHRVAERRRHLGG